MTPQPWMPNPPATRISSLMSLPGDTSNCAFRHCCAFMCQENKVLIFLMSYLLTRCCTFQSRACLSPQRLAHSWYHSLSQTLPWL